MDLTDFAVALILGPKTKTIRPADLVPPGAQIPLFIGPCFHCGQGLVHQLPHTCPSCGSHLTSIVPPEVATAGPRMRKLWLRLFRWQQFLEDILYVGATLNGQSRWLSAIAPTGRGRP